MLEQLGPYVRSKVRRAPLAERINGFRRAHELSRGLIRLEKHYQMEYERRGIAYDTELAWTEARRNILRRMRGHNDVTGHRKSLRIFWVGADEAQDNSGLLQALQAHGHVVTFRNPSGGYGQCFRNSRGHVEAFSAEVVSLNSNQLLEQVRQQMLAGGVDLLMGQMWANYISPEALRNVQSWGVPIINISMDDKLPSNWANIRGRRMGAVGLAHSTDLVLTTTSQVCAWYAVEGCPAVFWPLASDPQVFQRLPRALRDIDVLFVGNRYGVRERLIRDLGRLGVTVSCYGQGWPRGPVGAKEASALYARAKIVLGVGTVGYSSKVFTLKLRDFDAIMSGALYITTRSPEISFLFSEGREFEGYDSTLEAAEKINRYLADPDSIDRVGQAGRRKALADHTWHRRFSDTFGRLGITG